MKGQASLETLILLGGLLAFFVSWFSVIGPVQEKAKGEAIERLQQVAFERLVFAVRMADRLGEGSALTERVFLPSEARVSLGEKMTWSFGNTTWSENLRSRLMELTLSGRGVFHVENRDGVSVSWR